MEWDGVIELVSKWRVKATAPKRSKDEKTAEIVDIIQNFDKVNSFLDEFHEQLSICTSAQECARMFPKGARLLSELARNRIFILHPTSSQLIVKCLVEFSKIFNNFSIESCKILPKSNDWCFRQLRSLFLCRNIPVSNQTVWKIQDFCLTDSYSNNRALAEGSISIITQCLEALQNQSILLPADSIKILSEQCIPLLGDMNALNMIDQIIRTGTKGDSNEYLSALFVENLVFCNSKFHQKLSNESKLGLSACFPFVVEHEVMTLFGQLLFPIDKYTSPTNIKALFRQGQLFQHIFMCSRIFLRCIDVFVEFIDDTPDWRILRLVTYFTQSVLEQIVDISADITLYLWQPFQFLVSILNSVIAGPESFVEVNLARRKLLLEGLPVDYEWRRKQVWILLLSFSKWRHWIIAAIFDQDKYPNIKQLEAPINYFVWLICPRDDAIVLNLTNIVADIIVFLRECFTNYKSQESRNEVIVAYLDNHKRKFDENPMLVDIVLGFWPKSNSFSLMDAMVKYCVSPCNVSKNTPQQANAKINLSALTIILDYFHENIQPFENGNNDLLQSYYWVWFRLGKSVPVKIQLSRMAAPNKRCTVVEDDEDLDDLLDNVLDNFSTVSSSTSESTSFTTPPVPSNPSSSTDQESSNGSNEEFVDQLSANMEALVNGLGDINELRETFEALLKSGESDFDGSLHTEEGSNKKSFQEQINQTINKLQKSSDQVDAEISEEANEEFLAEMMKQMENLADNAEFQNAFDGMMEQFTSKDILYEPIKDLATRWLEENKEKVSREEYERFRNQSEYVQKIVAFYEAPDYQENNEQHNKKILDLMQKLQDFGQPPSEILAELAPDMELDEQGVPKFSPGDLDKCTLM
ncbi:hypothetical protein G9A89_022473 [Geosiphon pyriformis]|nr:hypothetical protein G9A89_022473 [Geosiphon pyriformis]